MSKKITFCLYTYDLTLCGIVSCSIRKHIYASEYERRIEWQIKWK